MDGWIGGWVGVDEKKGIRGRKVRWKIGKRDKEREMGGKERRGKKRRGGERREEKRRGKEIEGARKAAQTFGAAVTKALIFPWLCLKPQNFTSTEVSLFGCDEMNR